MKGIVVAHGPRATERAVFRAVDAHRDASGTSAGNQWADLRIIVPSASLRQHLLRALVKRYGRAVAGIRVQTLWGLAQEVLFKRGVVPASADDLFRVVVARQLEIDGKFYEYLLSISDGAGAVSGAVRDLLDAGYTHGMFEAAGECLATPYADELIPDPGPMMGTSSVKQAVDVLRIAADTEKSLDDLEVWTTARVFMEAAEHLHGALPHTRVLVHGFAEATGAASELIEALVQHQNATVFIDLPMDPSQAGSVDLGRRFAGRLMDRLAPYGQSAESEADDEAADTAGFVAHGRASEIREVALRIRALLDAGSSPEDIGVVARDLSGYGQTIRTQFERMGIPFAAEKARGPILPAMRPIYALCRMLRDREKTRSDVWVSVSNTTQSQESPLAGFDLRACLRSLGCSRLEDVVRLNVEEMYGDDGVQKLPVVEGLLAPDEPGDRRGVRHRTLPRATVEELVTKIRTAVTALGSIGESEFKTFDQWRDWLTDLGTSCMGWEEDTELRLSFESVCSRISLPDDFQLLFSEWMQILESTLEAVAYSELGGPGAGVQVLDAMQARGRTFQHLFLVGMNRGLFPRTSPEDPLFSDSLRVRLRRGDLLREIPIKRLSTYEERYLFAQLMGAAQQVTVSWLTTDERGHDCFASPYVERLRSSLGWEEDAQLSIARGPTTVVLEDTARPYLEHAVIAGLVGDRQLSQQIVHAAHRVGANPNLTSADIDARFQILNEQAPDFSSDAGQVLRSAHGPYLGFIGPAQDSGDPRSGRLFVTRLEDYARCPWKMFVGRYLGLEPVRDPFEMLSGSDNLLLGNLVHGVLEVIGKRPDSPRLHHLDEAQAALTYQTPWPSKERLQALIEHVVHDVFAEKAGGLLAFSQAIVRRSMPYFDVARDEWGQGLDLVGVELEGRVDVPLGTDDEGTRPVFFKTDRADIRDGLLRLTDYKTGKSQTRGEFLKRFRQGTMLQAALYAASQPEHKGLGRYLFLRPELKSKALRDIAFQDEESASRDELLYVLGLLIRGLEQGIMSPRLSEPGRNKEPDQCGRCEVAEACYRGDSNIRGRLRGLAGEEAVPPDEDEWSQGFQRIWRLAGRKRRGK